MWDGSGGGQVKRRGLGRCQQHSRAEPHREPAQEADSQGGCIYGSGAQQAPPRPKRLPRHPCTESAVSQRNDKESGAMVCPGQEHTQSHGIAR